MPNQADWVGQWSYANGIVAISRLALRSLYMVWVMRPVTG